MESPAITAPESAANVESWVAVVCSPKVSPVVMRVFAGPRGRGDSHEGKETFAAADHLEAA
jgi:hypothetical protein